MFFCVSVFCISNLSVPNFQNWGDIPSHQFCSDNNTSPFSIVRLLQKINQSLFLAKIEEKIIHSRAAVYFLYIFAGLGNISSELSV